MLKNEDIICISSIDWDFIWQGHQEIMARLARNGNRVLFIENTGVRTPKIKDLGRIKQRILNWRKGVHGIRKIEENLYVYSPIVLPFPYLKIARLINKRLIFSVLFKWLKTVGFSEPIVWIFLPTGLSMDLIDEIQPKILIYYCIDSFEASSKDARKVRRTEKLISKRADLIFVTSGELLRHCAQYNKKVYYFPFGVNIENFKRALSDQERDVPEDIKSVKKPIAGYIGGIHRWIDFDLVCHAAIKNPNVSFVFCGPIQTDISKLKKLPNVIFLGQKEPAALPMYVREFDVAMIPYKITDYTNNVYPTKLNEYLSLGKTVISTDLPEVKEFNKENNGIVKVCRNPEEFSDSIRTVIECPAGKEEESLAIKIAERNSWSNRVEEMSALIEDVGRDRMKQRDRFWITNLNMFYKKTGKKILPAIAAAALLYMIFFRTPFIWFLGEPLQIRDNPKPSDVIVALGGGVGESGKAGQGYQERVYTATNLYNKHLGRTILYSTGYRYILKEAQVMKTLSISMGVREQDVMIDDTPANTYEMMIDLANIAKKNNWKSVIIVSSPYHMLRVKLLCRKYLGNTIVYYVPVENSSFYAKSSPIKIRCITGILQEYLAIVYYKIKNYI